jgi:hypothetical protein
MAAYSPRKFFQYLNPCNRVTAKMTKPKEKFIRITPVLFAFDVYNMPNLYVYFLYIHELYYTNAEKTALPHVICLN